MAIAAADGYFIEVPALRFAGEGDATIDFGKSPLELGESFTLELWFRPDEIPQGGVSVLAINLVETAAGGTENIHLCLWLDSGIPSLSAAADGQIRETAQVAPAVQQEKSWCHVAVVCDQGALKTILYRSEAKAVETRSLSIGASDGEALVLQKLVLASLVQQGLTTVLFNGAFAELRLWNGARSESEINVLRLQQLVGNEPDLVGYWMLDEIAGFFIHDSSPQDNDGVSRLGDPERDSGLELMIGWLDRKTGKEMLLDEARLEYLENSKLPSWEVTHAQRTEEFKILERSVNEQRAGLTTAEEECADQNASVDAKLRRKQKQLEDRATEITREKAKIMEELGATHRVMLSDFIERLQDEVATSKMKIAKEYGSVYGLDEVVLDVKMVPGYAGVGLQLPDAQTKTETGRLSRLTVRLRARRVDKQIGRLLAAVPKLEGTTEAFARRRLMEAGFRAEFIYEGVESAEWHGRVLRQIDAEKRPEPAELDSVITMVVGQLM